MSCKKGSPLHTELKAAWKSYIDADQAALDKYHRLFPVLHNPKMEFVTFQQVVLKDKVSAFTEEELSAIDDYIDKHFEEKKEQEDHPWKMLKVDEAQSEPDLKRQYIEE